MPPWQIFCWPFKVTSTVLCIVDEAGLGTALIVGCMSRMKIVNHEDHKTTHLQEKKSKQINQLQ